MRNGLMGIALVLSWCVVADPSFGATNLLRVGLAGGGGIGYVSYGSQFDKIKLTGGITVDRRVGQGVALRTGVYWRPGGSGLSSIIPENINLVLRSDYIALPIGASFRLKAVRWFPLFLYGAAETAYLVRARKLEEEMNTGPTDTDVTDLMHRWDIAPVVGLAVATSDGLELALQHSWGLVGVYKDPYAGETKNRSVWLVGTLWFRVP